MLLDPIIEYASISKWVVDLIGKRITPHSFVRQLGKHLSKHHDVKVKFHKDNNNKLDEGDFTFGGEYDPVLDEDRRKQFKLHFIVNHPKKLPWLITGEMADNITLEIVETLVHEYRHQHQYRSREFILNRDYVSKHSNIDVKHDQEYLGMPDEIDAYAANIAARYYILKYKLNTNEPPESLDLIQYRRTFGSNHPVMRKLLKKIAQNITYFKAHDNGKNRRRSKCRVRRPG